MPTLDMLEVKELADKEGIRIIGPNCPGIITPGECKLGMISIEDFTEAAKKVVELAK